MEYDSNDDDDKPVIDLSIIKVLAVLFVLALYGVIFLKILILS
jgi:hypothetical protein